MTKKLSRSSEAALPRISAAETAALLLAAGGPLFAKGVMVRRPWIVGILQATAAEIGEVKALQALRRRYGAGPLMLRLPFREQAVLVSPEHVRRVLAETPEPFESDSSEKHATLAHFEPAGSLISRGKDRAVRRAFNEQVLETGCPVHGLASRFGRIIAEEAGALIDDAERAGALDWGAFKDAWFRTVRRCTFGDAAAGDTDLIRQMIALRSRGNWAFLLPKRRTLRARTLSRIAAYVHEAAPDTLAALAKAAAAPGSRPEDQIAQWLFAFDAAGIATFRALAVLASSTTLTARARGDSTAELPFLRACVLEAVRLWPTTPAILRQTDRDTQWDGAVMPAGAGVLIHVPFLHRDDERLPFANRFAPDIWLDGEAPRWTLIPFSGGTGECPARNLVLLLASRTLAAMIGRHDVVIPAGRRLDPDAMPATLDQFHLSVAVTTMHGHDDAGER
jgi:cytochrome P450